MNASPVQLQVYSLSKVLVVPIKPPELIPTTPPENFDWQGVNFKTEIEFGWVQDHTSQKEPCKFVVRLGVAIDNETGTSIPCNVDLEVIGYFELLGDIPVEDRMDIARVNGASLLFGVLREVLYSLTARFPTGQIILPCMNFLDLRDEHPVASKT